MTCQPASGAHFSRVPHPSVLHFATLRHEILTVPGDETESRDNRLLRRLPKRLQRVILRIVDFKHRQQFGDLQEVAHTPG